MRRPLRQSYSEARTPSASPRRFETGSNQSRSQQAHTPQGQHRPQGEHPQGLHIHRPTNQGSMPVQASNPDKKDMRKLQRSQRDRWMKPVVRRVKVLQETARKENARENGTATGGLKIVHFGC